MAFKAGTCSIERTQDGVRVFGELDLHAAPALRMELTRLIAEGHRDVVVDLTETTFLDSTALGALAGRFRELRSRGGSLAVITQQRERALHARGGRRRPGAARLPYA